LFQLRTYGEAYRGSRPKPLSRSTTLVPWRDELPPASLPKPVKQQSTRIAHRILFRAGLLTELMLQVRVALAQLFQRDVLGDTRTRERTLHPRRARPPRSSLPRRAEASGCQSGRIYRSGFRCVCSLGRRHHSRPVPSETRPDAALVGAGGRAPPPRADSPSGSTCRWPRSCRSGQSRHGRPGAEIQPARGGFLWLRVVQRRGCRTARGKRIYIGWQRS
jgi:hypothetical protein